MAPAVRWIVGIILFLIAGALWMYWKPGDVSKSSSSADAAKQSVTTSTDQAAAAKAKADADAAAAAAKAKADADAAAAAAKAKADAEAAALAAATLTASLLFDFDRSALRPTEKPKLDALAAKLKGKTLERVDAVGYADRIGEEPYNDKLSRKRADVVVAYLVSKGVDAGKVRTDAKGENEAVTGDACKNMGPESASNHKLVDCLQRDRHVEIVLVAR
jgi:OmpA-OmpF porin, OOP family